MISKLTWMRDDRSHAGKESWNLETSRWYPNPKQSPPSDCSHGSRTCRRTCEKTRSRERCPWPDTGQASSTESSVAPRGRGQLVRLVACVVSEGFIHMWHPLMWYFTVPSYSIRIEHGLWQPGQAETHSRSPHTRSPHTLSAHACDSWVRRRCMQAMTRSRITASS